MDISQFFWGGIPTDCSLSTGGGGVSVELSGDPSTMTIELEMNLILFVCTPLYMMGEVKNSRVKRRRHFSDQSE